MHLFNPYLTPAYPPWLPIPDSMVQALRSTWCAHRALAKIDGLYEVIHKAWLEDVGGNLAVLKTC
ncbi:hypothetical protein F2S88_14260 [Pseudomonas syringae pv. actinidiae]|nr:hypothetical protein [Pseudomonas syringae pv. actinidiae]